MQTGTSDTVMHVSLPHSSKTSLMVTAAATAVTDHSVPDSATARLMQAASALPQHISPDDAVSFNLSLATAKFDKMRQIEPTQLASKRSINVSLFTWLHPYTKRFIVHCNKNAMQKLTA